MDIDVFVPLYANTFPLATVAERAARKSAKVEKPTIAIQDFDWNWAKPQESTWSTPRKPPPFLSSRPYQLFFATESEFRQIHEAGISFLAVPVSVFHPRFIFLGLPPRVKSTNEHIITLKNLISEACKSRNGSQLQKADLPFQLTWVSDIPSQAKLLAGKVAQDLGKCGGNLDDESLVKFYGSRSLAETLGINSKAVDGHRPVKAFIWGGPLASVAQKDAAEQGKRRRWLRLRDPRRASVCIELPSLLNAFTEEEIRREHALYCCVGFKENRHLRDYYIRDLQLDHKVPPWQLSGHKYDAVSRDPQIPTLVQNVESLFDSIFAAARAAEPGAPVKTGTRRVRPAKMFETFQSDYDKFCRTRNPVAQLFTSEDYVKCLCDHHDSDAFAALFPDRAPTARY